MAGQKRNRRGRDDVNVFSQGVLVHLQVSCWGASAKLEKEHLGEEVPKEIVRAVYDLLDDKTFLEDLHSIRSEAKRFLYRNSLPFPVDGLVFIPKPSIERIDEGLKTRRGHFEEAVEDFLRTYESKRSAFAEKYPKIYQPQKYPSVSQMAYRFRFNWSFRHFTVPDAEMSLLPPELYKEEERKFKAEMRQMKDTAISVIGQEFIKKIDILKEQCFDDNINTATVNAFHTFLDKFDNLWKGFVGHAALKRMIEEAKEYMDGTEADMLRADDSFRQLVGNKMKDITEQFQKIPDARLKRKLDL